MVGSNILDVVAGEVAILDAVSDGLCVSSGSCLLPLAVESSGAAGDPDVVVVEAVELLEVGGTALLAEGFEEDQVLAVLERGVLDVLDGLEEGRDLPGDLALLLGLRTALAGGTCRRVSAGGTWRRRRCGRGRRRRG